MKAVTISELKKKLRVYLQLAKKGETVIVYDRKLAIAEIHPHHFSDKERIDDLVRRGIARRGDPSKLKDYDFPKSSEPSYGVLESLLQERAEDSR